MKNVVISDATKQDFKDISKHKKEFDISIPDLRSHTLVARTPSGELLGYLEISYSKPTFIEVKRLAVRAKYKRIGVGRKLMGIARAISLKERKKIIVNSRTDSDAQNFWKNRQGFKPTNKEGRFELLEELVLKPKAIRRQRKPRPQAPKIQKRHALR